jgi:hypothetical protein
LLLMVISLDDVGQWRNPIHIRLSTLLFVFFFPGPLFSQQLGAQKIHKYKRA